MQAICSEERVGFRGMGGSQKRATLTAQGTGEGRGGVGAGKGAIG